LTKRDQAALTHVHLPSRRDPLSELCDVPARPPEALPDVWPAHLPQPGRPLPPSLHRRAGWSTPSLQRVPPRVHRRRPGRPASLRFEV